MPEPRLRHDHEQLELLAQRGKLDAAGLDALAVLRRHHDPRAGIEQRYALAGQQGDLLLHALTATHYRPDTAFSGRALGGNDTARSKSITLPAVLRW